MIARGSCEPMKAHPAVALYGIKNCNSVKKASNWLDEKGVAYVFHDLKKEPPSPALLDAWLAKLAWGKLLNRKGTTWRMLEEKERQAVQDASSACAAMLEKPMLIKRPVIEWAPGLLSVGFDEIEFEKLAHCF